MKSKYILSLVGVFLLLSEHNLLANAGLVNNLGNTLGGTVNGATGTVGSVASQGTNTAVNTANGALGAAGNGVNQGIGTAGGAVTGAVGAVTTGVTNLTNGVVKNVQKELQALDAQACPITSLCGAGRAGVCRFTQVGQDEFECNCGCTAGNCTETPLGLNEQSKVYCDCKAYQGGCVLDPNEDDSANGLAHTICKCTTTLKCTANEGCGGCDAGKNEEPICDKGNCYCMAIADDDNECAREGQSCPSSQALYCDNSGVCNCVCQSRVCQDNSKCPSCAAGRVPFCNTDANKCECVECNETRDCTGTPPVNKKYECNAQKCQIVNGDCANDDFCNQSDVCDRGGRCNDGFCRCNRCNNVSQCPSLSDMGCSDYYGTVGCVNGDCLCVH